MKSEKHVLLFKEPTQSVVIQFHDFRDTIVFVRLLKDSRLHGYTLNEESFRRLERFLGDAGWNTLCIEVKIDDNNVTVDYAWRPFFDYAGREIILSYNVRLSYECAERVKYRSMLRDYERACPYSISYRGLLDYVLTCDKDGR